ncbi:MAG TPA: glycosyltransferase [Phycisphaerae bacterium]|nr:glycosyltransferase [Phycisphaerae bacterium]
MRVFAPTFGFLQPYCEPYAEFVGSAAEADFVLGMNMATHDGLSATAAARDAAEKAGKPFCWWTIEDPNAYHPFLAEARMADFVFTSDRCCIPNYRAALQHNRVFWLPLAAEPLKMHVPMPLADDAADIALSCNWYDTQWEARKWATKTMILPLARAGYSMAIFSYEIPPYPELQPFWRGGTSCYTSAEQYRHGRIVLGQNNQRSGMDGRAKTVMTSMRTFEALACGKPFLAPYSDAYGALGFVNHKHMVWVDTPEQAVEWGEDLLDNACAAATKAKTGMEFVRRFHTYGKRLDRIVKAISGKANPDAWD